MKSYQKIYAGFAAFCAVFIMGSTLLMHPVMAQAPGGMGGFSSIKEGCLDPKNPQGREKCKELCTSGLLFYCEALGIKPPQTSNDTKPAYTTRPSGSPNDKPAHTTRPSEPVESKPAHTTRPPEASQTKPVTQEACDIADDKLPELEGLGADYYAKPYWVTLLKTQTRAQALQIMCTTKKHVPACKALCKIGCNQYCNICSLSADGNFGSEYKFLTQSLTPPPNHMESSDTKQTIISHNCNPATKKRGVGIIPGGDEGFIGVGYGTPQHVKGFCNEELGANYIALRRAWEAGKLGSQTEYDGIPSNLEMVWACINHPKCGPFNKEWLHAHQDGARKENPIRAGKYSAYNDIASLVPLREGVNSYTIPPYSTGEHRYNCGDPVWIEYSAASDKANTDSFAAECRGGNSGSCHTLCSRGAGYEQYCALKVEMSDLRSCKQYRGHHDTPSCKKLCATGKEEYKQYCPPLESMPTP